MHSCSHKKNVLEVRRYQDFIDKKSFFSHWRTPLLWYLNRSTTCNKLPTFWCPPEKQKAIFFVTNSWQHQFSVFFYMRKRALFHLFFLLHVVIRFFLFRKTYKFWLQCLHTFSHYPRDMELLYPMSAQPVQRSCFPLFSEHRAWKCNCCVGISPHT